MPCSTQPGLVKGHGLTEAEQAAVARLATICNRYESLDLPVSWGAPGTAPPGDPVDRLFYYDQGGLIGFAGLQGDTEIEVYGMVHPEHRRRGIGRTLLAAARDECRQRGSGGLLLVVEERSASGRAFAEAIGGEFRFAEYSMDLNVGTIDRSRPRNAALVLHPAATADAAVIARVQAAAFGDAEEEMRRRVERGLRDPNQRYFLASLDGEPVGTLRMSDDGHHAYVTAFGVLPAYQGRGIGRQMLRETIDMLLAEGSPPIRIEVETENANALGLYRSCGFRETTAFRYYDLDAQDKRAR